MLRQAIPDDTKAILELIKELAIYEKEPDAVLNTEEELHRDLFIDKRCFALVWDDEKSGVVGFALYYFGYSTWKGKTIYLEDLYVKPEYREQKIGGKLFEAVIEVAKAHQVRRMDWQVLAWNTPAIEFYKKYNALLDPEWLNGRFHF